MCVHVYTVRIRVNQSACNLFATMFSRQHKAFYIVKNSPLYLLLYCEFWTSKEKEFHYILFPPESAEYLNRKCIFEKRKERKKKRKKKRRSVQTFYIHHSPLTFYFSISYINSFFFFFCFFFLSDTESGSIDGINVNADKEPEFKAPIENITVPLGREAVLKCLVTDLGNYKVIFFFRLMFNSVFEIAGIRLSECSRSA